MDQVAASLRSVTRAGPGGIAVEIETPGSFDASPGQFVKLTATVDGEDVSSFYTISSPRVTETFEVTVAVDPDGDLSPWLAEATPGVSLEMTGPFGSAHYEGEPRVVIVCGGPGIGPAVAIAERAVADGGAAAVVYRDDDPLHLDRLDALAADGASVHVLGTGDPLAPLLTEAVTGDADEQVFVYGFSDFVDEAEATLDGVGIGREPKVENFG
ncbi:FAD-dependent oxidoreductase [Haloglomus litoreum]|uniref:FAD-dependent oxidoreductase n=1 Tax=Haloglomus litoreum TaxID=3034026 RepID=UPI0023E8F064|nr:FAD-dependent oxidoreductase [Haloglomus sp. DT116]